MVRAYDRNPSQRVSTLVFFLSFHHVDIRRRAEPLVTAQDQNDETNEHISKVEKEDFAKRERIDFRIPSKHNHDGLYREK